MSWYLSNRASIFKLSFVLIDFILIFLAFNIGFIIRMGFGSFNFENPGMLNYLSYSVMLAVFGVSIEISEGLFAHKNQLDYSNLVIKIIKVSTILTVCGTLVSFFARELFLEYGISRIVIVLSLFLTIIFLFLSHYVSNKVIMSYRRRGIGLRKAIIIGTDEVEKHFWDNTKNNIRTGLDILGFIKTNDSLLDSEIEENVVGKLENLKAILIKNKISEVILSNPSLPKSKVLKVIDICSKLEIRANIIPDSYSILTYKPNISSIGDMPMITLDDIILKKWNKFTKNIFDIVIASIMLLALSPIMILTAFLIKFDSEGPIFFKQLRIGKGERPFRLYKFRTMKPNADAELKNILHLNEAHGPIFKMKSDPRITFIGRYLRKLSIDELPQLINVILGEMSLVGPRPPVEREVNLYKEWQLKRFDVKPGLTGLPQVSGRSKLNFDEMLELDIYYMRNWSILLDLKILVKTVTVVLKADGAY